MAGMKASRKARTTDEASSDQSADTDDDSADEELVDPSGDETVNTGFKPWDNQAVSTTFGYDVKAKEFTTSVKVSQKERFKLTPLTVADGPFKGRNVLMLVPTTEAFRFMDLPPELRNRIYRYVLGSNSQFFSKSRRGKNGSKEKGRRLRAQQYIRQTHRNAPGYTRAIKNESILTVSKEVTREVAPMLYGAESFNFDSSRKLKHFVSGIGSMVVYLRDICIWKISQSTLRTACNALKKASSLCSLIIYYEPLRMYGDTRGTFLMSGRRSGRRQWALKDGSEVLDYVLPLVKAQHKLQMRKPGSKSIEPKGRPKAVDMVRFRAMPCTECSDKDDKCCDDKVHAENKADSERFTLVLKTKLVEALEETAT